jgi:hypothetical protein
MISKNIFSTTLNTHVQKHHRGGQYTWGLCSSSSRYSSHGEQKVIKIASTLSDALNSDSMFMVEAATTVVKQLGAISASKCHAVEILLTLGDLGTSKRSPVLYIKLGGFFYAIVEF